MADWKTESLQCFEARVFHFTTRKGIYMHRMLGQLVVFRASS
jgi:hypothetical protein